jgi:hypothetical protein
MPVQCICLQCGRAFTKPPSVVAAGNGKLCSRACQFLRQRLCEPRSCEYCGATFTPRPEQSRRGAGRYCSHACSVDARRRSLADRLLERLDTSGGPDACWPVRGARNARGYGKIGLGERDSGDDYTHRVAYRLFVGTIPDGHEVCHHCDNPPCGNPRHLFTGIHKANMEDGSAKGRVGNVPLIPDETILRLFLAHDNGERVTDIAVRHGMSHSYVSQILSGQRRQRLGRQIPARTQPPTVPGVDLSPSCERTPSP